MISVLVLGSNTATGRPPRTGDAVRTLAALVPGAVDGFIRDAVLVATPAAAELAAVADHAGCGFVAEPDFARALAAGAGLARSEHLLVLLAGLAFDRALSEEVATTVARRPAWLRAGVGLRPFAEGWVGRLVPGLTRPVGLLATRARIERAASPDFARLCRDLRLRHFLTTRVWVAED